MRTSTPMSHDAMFYDSDHEFAAAMVPFIQDGLDQGGAVVAAVTTENIAILRDALGPEAATVTFLDRDRWYSRPASTVAGWQRLLTDATDRGHGHLRVIGEVGFGTADRHVSWTRYESAVNEIFAGTPTVIVCPYDRRALPATVIDDARRTHPTLFGAGRPENDSYEQPERFLRNVPEPMPPTIGPPVLTLKISEDVALPRHAVAALLDARGWTEAEGGSDLMVAMCEIVTNAVVHGGGLRELRLWLDGSRVTCEVTDQGEGPADPLAGYRPPALLGTRGRGLWITQQLCDTFGIERHDGRTVVRFTITLP